MSPSRLANRSKEDRQRGLGIAGRVDPKFHPAMSIRAGTGEHDDEIGSRQELRSAVPSRTSLEWDLRNSSVMTSPPLKLAGCRAGSATTCSRAWSGAENSPRPSDITNEPMRMIGN